MVAYELKFNKNNFLLLGYFWVENIYDYSELFLLIF